LQAAERSLTELKEFASQLKALPNIQRHISLAEAVNRVISAPAFRARISAEQSILDGQSADAAAEAIEVGYGPLKRMRNFFTLCSRLTQASVFSWYHGWQQQLVTCPRLWEVVQDGGAAQEMMCNEEDMHAVLRLMCLLSLTQNGIAKKYFDALRKEFLQSYGHEYLLMLSKLQDAGGCLNPLCSASCLLRYEMCMPTAPCKPLHQGGNECACSSKGAS
jgi:hypothetical protein